MNTQRYLAACCGERVGEFDFEVSGVLDLCQDSRIGWVHDWVIENFLINELCRGRVRACEQVVVRQLCTSLGIKQEVDEGVRGAWAWSVERNRHVVDPASAAFFGNEVGVLLGVVSVEELEQEVAAETVSDCRLAGDEQLIELRRIERCDTIERRRNDCLLYTSPSPRDQRGSRMPSSA